MDIDLFWNSLTVFNFLFLFLWVIFYTYQPSFMKDEDFVAPGSSVRGSSDNNTKERSDKYLSDPGRSLIFLSSLITSLVVVILGVIFVKYVITRKKIKCKKGAKNIKDCQIINV